MGLILFFRYLFVPLLPFLLSLLPAGAVCALSRALAKKLRAPEKALSAFLLSAALLLFFAALFFGAKILYRELYEFLTEEENLLKSVLDTLEKARAAASLRFPALAPYLEKSNAEGALKDLFANAALFLSKILMRSALALPEALFFAFAASVSAFYIALDGEKLLGSLKRLCPPALAEQAEKAIRGALRSLFGYLKAAGILSGVTFLLLLAGLLLLKIPYALFLSLFTAAVDFLPVLGTGTVLLPYALFLFLSGSPLTGAGLVGLWALTQTVRRLLEPKVLGKSLGMHPLFTLIFSYAGFRLFGAWGLILAPVGASVLYSLMKGAVENGRT